MGLLRLIESNVAIIVGCMPGFAQLLKAHTGGSSFFTSLRSRVRDAMARGSSGSKNSSKRHVLDGSENPSLGAAWTAPLPNSKRRQDYYEMSDTVLLNSQIMASGERREPKTSSQEGIVRCVDISQQWHSQHYPDSREDLVHPGHTYQR